MFDKELVGFGTPLEYLKKVAKVLDIVLHDVRVKGSTLDPRISDAGENVWGTIVIGRKPRRLFCILETEEATAETCFNVVLIDYQGPGQSSPYEFPIRRVELGNLYDLEESDILVAASELFEMADGLL